MTQVFPIKNHIMFQFLDDTGGSKGKFSNRSTASGIIIAQTDMQQKVPRWGKVYNAGPESLVKEGEFILIEALMWSYGTEINDDLKLWKTDDSKVLMVTTDEALTNGTEFE